MDHVDKIVQALDLPLVLQNEAFSHNYEESSQLPDVTVVISMLPDELYPYLDLDVTASHRRKDGQIIYRLLLVDDGSLKIRVENRQIVEITRSWD